MGDELKNKELDTLDDFDLDLGADDDLDAGESGGIFGEDEPTIPKRKVTEIVKKRLAKERDRQRKLYDDFKKVYGMSPEEAIEFGLKEQRRYATNFADSQQASQSSLGGVRPGGQLPVDPVLVKIAEIDSWRRDLEERQQREREALEFVQRYPNVKFEDIPKEVLDRRARGGVTLAEAYKLYMADKEAQEAAKKAAEAAARNMRRGSAARAEGANYGGAGDDVDFLSEEERQFAKLFGMTPKEYLAYRQKAKNYRKEEGV